MRVVVEINYWGEASRTTYLPNGSGSGVGRVPFQSRECSGEGMKWVSVPSLCGGGEGDLPTVLSPRRG